MTPALSDLNLPFASKLPKPEELAGNAYNFAMKILAEPAEVRRGRAALDRAAAPRQQRDQRQEDRGPAQDRDQPQTSGTAKKTGSGRLGK